MEANKIKVVQWNCRGARTNFGSIMGRYRKLTPIYALQETWLSPEIRFTIPGYNIIRNDRLDRPGGGVALLFPKEYNIIDWEKVNTTNVEAITARIKGGNKDMTIINAYCPMSNKLQIEDIEELEKRLAPTTLMVGDFNEQHTAWGGGHDSRGGKIIMDLCERKELIILNDGTQTRINPIRHRLDSTPDISIVTRNISTATWTAIEETSSDHKPIEIALGESYKVSTGVVRPTFNFLKADWESFRDDLDKLAYKDEDFIETNECAKKITTDILKAAAKNIPNRNLPESITGRNTPTGGGTGANHKNPAPWYTGECDKKLKARKKALKRFRRSRSIETWLEYTKLRNEANKCIKEAKILHFRKYAQHLDPTKDSISSIWKKIKAMKGDNAKKVMPAIRTPEMAYTDKQKAVLAKHFYETSSDSSLGGEEIERRETTIKELEENRQPTGEDACFNANITEREVIKAIQSKSDSAAGPDILNYRILKNVPQTTLAVITRLYNGVWATGEVPRAWKTATVIPLLKSGKPPHEANSYRPIALTSHLGKVLETVIKTRLSWFLERYKLLSVTQSGFRKKRCTIDQLIKLENEVKEGFVKKKKTVAIFLDMSKAYDICWREGALHKIEMLGIGGRALHYLKNFLAERTFRVQINNDKSAVYIQENGIPQGAVLSPLIFAIMVNDLNSTILDPSNRLSQFADDIAFWRSAINNNIGFLSRKLQAQMDVIHQWMKAWGFKLNADKTVGMIFSQGKTRPTDDIEVTIDGVKISEVEHTTFLGMTIDKHMNWKAHINKLVESCRGLLNMLRYLRGSGWGASTETLLTIYKSFIRGKLDYGSILYDSAAKTYIGKVDQIQSKALRSIVYASTLATNEALQVVLGVPPLNLRRKELRLNYAIKATNDSAHPAHHAFNNKGIGIYLKNTSTQPACWRTAEEEKETPRLTEAMKRIKPYSATIPPWELETPATNTELSESQDKLTDDQRSLGRANNFIDRIKGPGMEIYTDGSKDEQGNVGVGVYVADWKVRKQYRITKDVSIFTAEMIGILKALELLLDKPPIQATIFTDSLSSVQSLRGTGDSCRPDVEEEILHLNTRLKREGCEVTIAWIPAHIGIVGNERADKLANAGRESQNYIEVGLIESEIKSIVRETINNQWVEQWKVSHKGRMAFHTFKLPTRKSQITTKLKIPMNRKLLMLRLGSGRFLWESPYCYACMEHYSIQHLFECIDLENERLDLESYCIKNDISMLAETLLDTQLARPVQTLVRQFISRANIVI
jgi:ribonuclease HI